jgi:hypothetical protein
MAAEPRFKGNVSDLGGPTANMYQMRCTKPEVEQVCRRLSCVHPTICKLLGTDHGPVIDLMKKSREVKEEIIQGLFIAGDMEHILELARTEPDRELRLEAIQKLGVMGARTAPALWEIYRGQSDPEIRERSLFPIEDDRRLFAVVDGGETLIVAGEIGVRVDTARLRRPWQLPFRRNELGFADLRGDEVVDRGAQHAVTLAIHAGQSGHLPRVESSHEVDRVRLRGGLVRPVALNPREAERQAAGVAAALLHAVEGDLDHELGTHVHDMPVALGREVE